MFGAFRQSHANKVWIRHYAGVNQNLFVIFSKSLTVPLRLSLPVSDCIHNLRAALDYLVYELAILDSGDVQEGSQFPIEDDPQVFHIGRRNTDLCGLRDDHVLAIETLQPYKGVQWTKTLRSISNPGNQNHLIPIQPRISSSLIKHFKADKNDFEFSVDGEKMYVKKEDVLSVGFSNGPVPVLETLNLLITNVSQTIESFKPEFK